MQKLLLIIVVSIGLYCTLAFGSLRAQSNVENEASALLPPDQIRYKLQEYEALAIKFETNSSLNPRDAFDEMRKGLQPLKQAVDILLSHQSSMEKKTAAGLWFELLAVIDKRYDQNFLATNPPVSIGVWISPPPEYKGKIGPSGMEPPSTNDMESYTYYVNAVNSVKDRAKKTNIQHELERLNNSVTFHVKRFLKSSYTASEADKKELDGILDHSKLSDSRKQQIRSAIAP